MVDKLVNRPPEGNPDNVRLDPDLPPKYSGKSVEEIARMHAEAEKRLGEMRQQLGKERQEREAYASLQARAPAAKAKAELDPDDPESYISAKVQEAIQPYAQVLAKQQEASFHSEMDRMHPDWKDIVVDEGFGDWVAKSKVRLGLYNAANAGYDINSASELLENWKARQASEQTVEKAAKQAVKKEKDLRAVSSEKRGSKPTTERVLKRSDIRALKQHRPEEYSRMRADIERAYREGRVTE